MRAERAVKRLVDPIASPASRKALIATRDAAVGGAARVASLLRLPRVEPEFVVIGAQKGGTTFLFQELLRHPDIHPALTKELHYFDDKYARGHQWYLGNFVTAGRSGIFAEASPSYLFHPRAPERMAEDLPSTKAIGVLRDPVARAFSHWRHERGLGFEPIDRFEDAIAAEEERTAADLARMAEDPSFVSFAWRHYTYRARGRYIDQMERWEAALGRDRVLWLDSADLYGETETTLDRVYDFLGLHRPQSTTIGRNDMAARDGEVLDPLYAAELRRYFEPWNQRLRERYGLGETW